MSITARKNAVCNTCTILDVLYPNVFRQNFQWDCILQRHIGVDTR